MSTYYQFYSNLRKLPPIKLKETWLVSRYDDVKTLFTEHELYSVERIELLYSKTDLTDPIINFGKIILEKSMLHMDTGIHDEKKEMIRQAHSFAAKDLKAVIDQRYAEVREQIKSKTEYDFRLDFVTPIIAHVCMAMVGMENITDLDKKIHKLYHHAEVVSLDLEPLVYDNETARRIATSMLYLLKIGRNYDGVDDNFPPEEYNADNWGLLEIQQGFITSTLIYSIVNMVSNIIYVMIENEDTIPDDRIKDAILEALRLESPVQGAIRIATADTNLGGSAIKKGDLLMAMVGSANRDERIPEFKDSAKFDINRKRIPMMTFGYGAHACVGKVIGMDSTNMIIPKLWNDRFFKIKEVVWADHVLGYRVMKSFIVENVPEQVMAAV